MQYDAKIIDAFAVRLYKRAAWIGALYTLFCGFLGFVGGWAVGVAARNSGLPAANVSAIIGAVLFGLVGYALGEEKRFQLKLQAQIALCQVQIERNVRRNAG
jgi:hypothetical protein